jgi:hypothetical protein
MVYYQSSLLSESDAKKIRKTQSEEHSIQQQTCMFTKMSGTREIKKLYKLFTLMKTKKN